MTMAIIPKTEVTTVTKIDEFWKAKQSQGRAHCGVSQIGGSCRRQIWYSFRWVLSPDFSGRLLRLFQFGHDYEAEFIKLLRQVGVSTFANDPATGKQFSVKWAGGHFAGSTDGMGEGFIEAPTTRHLLEFKTSADKQFKDLQKNGVEKSKPVHYTQMQCYMAGLKLTRAFYMVINKNTHELYGERINFDKEHADAAIQKGVDIVEAATPPVRISERPDWYECKWCDYNEICHGKDIPEVNCRTCVHSAPDTSDEGAQWFCNFYGDNIPLKNQRTGCDKHLYLPDLVPFEVVTANKEDNWILYSDGDKQFYNGAKDEDSYPSKEFRNIDGGILASDEYNKLKNALGVEVISKTKTI